MSNSPHIWRQVGDDYHPGDVSTNTKLLKPGIYAYKVSMQGWWLSRSAGEFRFPYKIYGNHDHILTRMKAAWEKLDGNLGILLNGVKGTGKTVTAQLAANWLVEQGIPVLAVNGPVPLTDILERLDQPMAVIFDEFEKTHNRDKGEQQSLLTALDGMARNEHKRLFIFTTNDKRVDTNFINRPSRIRYCWEFGRLSDEVVEELMDDLLEPELAEHKPAIAAYLHTRRVLSIDVVKTVLTEVNIFREAPESFSSIMNLTKLTPTGYIVDLLDKDGEVVHNLSRSFNTRDNTSLQTYLTRSGAEVFLRDLVPAGQSYSARSTYGNLQFEMLAPTDDPTIWACHVHLPFLETWVSKNFKLRERLYYDGLWVDEKPKGWTPPSWATKIAAGMNLTEEEDRAMEEWQDENMLYGTGEKKTLKIRFTASYETYQSHHVGAF